MWKEGLLRLVPVLLFAILLYVTPAISSTDILFRFGQTPPHPVRWVLYYGILLANPIYLVFLLRRSAAVTPVTWATQIDRLILLLVLLGFSVISLFGLLFPPGSRAEF